MPDEKFESRISYLDRQLERVSQIDQASAQWSEQDPELKSWLLPQLQKLRHDKRGSVARKAVKISTRVSE